MCEHCGCRGVEPLAELMDEHFALLEGAGDVRRALDAGAPSEAAAALGVLAERLVRHVGREERGVFAALKRQGDFAATVAELEAEHLTFDEQLSDLDPRGESFARDVRALLDDLAEHIDKENLGVFPVAVVSLEASGWDTVSRAHATEPSFLSVRAPA